MDTPLDYLRKHSQDNWLLGYDLVEFLSLTEALVQEFANPNPQKILLAESDPMSFLASFIAAGSTNHDVFLGNLAWGSSEWQQVFDLVLDVSVIGLPDSYWGQMIVAVYTPCQSNISSLQIKQAIEGKLSRYKHPKIWIPVDILPRNEQGKVNRKLPEEIAISRVN